MNQLPVYLYRNQISVILDPVQTRSTNRVMYQRKLKIRKGFKEVVDVVFKNSDQKPIPLTTGTNYYFDLFDINGQELIFSKPILNLDDNTLPNRGLCRITFDPLDTIYLPSSSYKFVIKQDNGDGTYTPAYSNTYYDVLGDIDITDDGFPIGFQIQVIDAKRLEASKNYDRTPNVMSYVFSTDWLRPVVRSGATTYVARFTLSSFVGSITVEGTLDNNPSGAGHANAQSFSLVTYNVASVTQGTIDLTWHVPTTAVRFRVVPKSDPFGTNYYPSGDPVGSNTNKFPSGFVEQIQYIS